MRARSIIFLRSKLIRFLLFGMLVSASVPFVQAQEGSLFSPSTRNPNGESDKKVSAWAAIRSKLGAPVATFTAGESVAPRPEPNPNSGGLFESGENPFAPMGERQPYCIWARADYLLWRMTEAPNAAPLVTTSAASDLGILGRASTRVLFGGQPLDLGNFSGVRLTVGMWFDRDAILGIEASGFVLPERVSRFDARTSGAQGSALLAVPFVDPAGNPRSIIFGNPSTIISSPGGPISTAQIPGSVETAYSSSLWGYEINGVFNVLRQNRWEASLLAGFRHLELREEFRISLLQQSTTTGLQSVTSTDNFLTRNRFDGGQIGARLTFEHNRFSLGLNAKVAIGNLSETVHINGTRSTTLSGGSTTAGGVLTQASNIGDYNRNQFRAIPEVGFEVSYRVLPRVRVIAGYNAIYWAQVVRPGSQIDPVLNIPNVRPNGSVFLNELFTDAVPGRGNPAPRFNQSGVTGRPRIGTVGFHVV